MAYIAIQIIFEVIFLLIAFCVWGMALRSDEIVRFVVLIFPYNYNVTTFK